MFSRRDVEDWLAAQAKKVSVGKYSPTTVNSWLRFCRSMNEAVDELALERNQSRTFTGST